MEPTPSIHLLAEIGIILLLFEVGLETDVSRLIKAGFKAGVVAIGGVVLPLLFGFALSFYVFHFSLLASLFVGCALTATSIGITLRVLSELKQQGSHEAQIILGAAVIDDIIGIILLSLLYEFSSSGDIDLWHAGQVLLFIVLFFILAPMLAKAISVIIRKWNEKSTIPGLLPTTIISLILFFAWLAHELGAPEMLGGFAAGLALSKQFYVPLVKFSDDSKDFSHIVHKHMQPIIHLFTPIFFVTIGLTLNLRAIAWDSPFIWMITSSLILIAIITKLAAGFLITKETVFTKLAIGVSMVPRGEVGLIFAGVGLSSAVFNNELYAAMILVIAITTLLPPFALRRLYQGKVQT